MRAIRELLGQLLAQPKLARKLHQHQLWDHWSEVVGPQIAATTAPKRFQDTTLVVSVTSSTWMQELTYLKPNLIEKLQQFLGPDALTDIRFELG